MSEAHYLISQIALHDWHKNLINSWNTSAANTSSGSIKFPAQMTREMGQECVMGQSANANASSNPYRHTNTQMGQTIAVRM